MMYQIHLVPNFKGNYPNDSKEPGLLNHLFHYTIQSAYVPRPGDVLTLSDYDAADIKEFELVVDAFNKAHGQEGSFTLKDYSAVSKVHVQASSVSNKEETQIYVQVDFNAKPSNRIGFL